MFIKLVIWCCVALGLAMAAWVAWSSWAVQRTLNQQSPGFLKYAEGQPKDLGHHLHDSYYVIGVGKWPLRVYPGQISFIVCVTFEIRARAWLRSL